ncbi:MAG: hypothetical protein KDB63_06735, partial [Nocardioidaceae bacterium]|nr:hypothetical protein [Nocardioidaceae bacterium]
DAGDPEAMTSYLHAVAALYADLQQRSLIERQFLPEEWQRATTLSDWAIRVTPSRAKALIDALVSAIEAEEEAPDETEGAVPFVVQLSSFPMPGSVLP